MKRQRFNVMVVAYTATNGDERNDRLALEKLFHSTITFCTSIDEAHATVQSTTTPFDAIVIASDIQPHPDDVAKLVEKNEACAGAPRCQVIEYPADKDSAMSSWAHFRLGTTEFNTYFQNLLTELAE
jgi:hypothetical protein